MAKRKQKRPTKEIRHLRFWAVRSDKDAKTTITKGGGLKMKEEAKQVTRENIIEHLKGGEGNPYVSAFESPESAECYASHLTGLASPMIDECQVTLKISFVKVKGAYGTDELFLPVWRAGRMIAGIWRPMMAKGAREVLFLEARIVTLLLDLDRKLVWRKGDDWLVMGEVLAGMRERSWVLEIEGKEVDVDWRDKEEDIATRQGVEEKVERIVLLDNERPPIRRKADSNEEERAGRDVSDKGLKDGGDDVSPPRLTGTPLSLLHRPKPHSMEGRHGEREVDELTGVLVLVDLSDAEYSSDDGFGGGGGGSKLTG